MSRSAPLPENVPLVEFIDHLRVQAAAPVAEIFRGRTAVADRVPGWGRSVLSKAKNADTSNPLFRMALMLVAAWRAGLTRAAADRLIGFLSTVRDLLWPVERICMDEAMRREARAEGAEHCERADWLTLRTESELVEFITELEREHAAQSVTIAVAHAHLIEMRRTKSARAA